MVGIPSSHGPESQNYFSTKNKVSKAGGGEPRGKKPQPSSKPFSQHNGQASPQPHHTKQHPVKPKFPSGQKQSRQNSSPKPILNNKNNSHARQLPNSLRCSPASSRSSPSSFRSSPPRSTTSPSRSSPNNFASSTCYQPPTPSSLPKPPTHWTCHPASPAQPATDPSTHLKLLLNLQA